MQPTLSDISTLKPGMKIYDSINDEYIEILEIKEDYILVGWIRIGIELKLGISVAEEGIKNGTWKLLEESPIGSQDLPMSETNPPPYDWKKELLERQNEFVFEDSMTRCGRIDVEALTQFIEEVIANAH